MTNQVESTISTLDPIYNRERRPSLTIEQLKRSFDDIVKNFDENHSSLSDFNLLKEVLESSMFLNDKDFSQLDFIHHRLLSILRDIYLTLIQHWRDGHPLEFLSACIFELIPNLFLKLSIHSSSTDSIILKELVFDRNLLHEVNSFLIKLSIDRKHLDDPHLKSFDSLIRTIQRLERHHVDHSNELLLDKFYENIVKCICSSSLMETFLQSIKIDNETTGQRFLLHTCIDYISAHSIDDKHKQSLLKIRQSLLHPFSQWLSEQSTYFRLWNNQMIILVRQFCFLLTLSIQLNRWTILETDIFNGFSQLIDSFVNILYSIIQSENNSTNKLAQSLIATLTPNLYTMILSKQLEKHLRDKHVTSLLLKLADIDNDEIQLNTFRILSLIVTEYEVKHFMDVTHLAQVFRKFFEKLMNDSHQTLRLSHLLSCLNNMIQYDVMKEELTKENILLLILRCIREKIFESLHSQQMLLEILLALTFDDGAYKQMQTNSTEILSILSTSYKNSSSTFQYLLWRLDPKQDLTCNDQVYQYDVVFINSSKDKDLCLQISNALDKENYRVWFDQDETLTNSMTEKASIIDQSEIVLFCLSDAFKQNSFCRSEALYTFQSQYQIVPLIVTSNYRPDGWIHPLIQGKIYIDFIKHDFQLAINKLKSEIQRYKSPFSITSSVPQPPILVESPKIKCESTTISSSSSRILSSNIQQWTNDDVQLFVQSQNFMSLSPILSEMNGPLLRELYFMCLSNRESMFHTLKNELTAFKTNTEPLTLLVYLRFLHEISNYISS